MLAERWRTAELREMLLMAAGRVTSRQLDLFNLWCCQILRPYFTDRRSIAAYHFAEDRLLSPTLAADRDHAPILDGAHHVVEESVKFAHLAPTAAESRKRRVYAHAALVAHQVLAQVLANGQSLPNNGVVSISKYTAYVFGWANDEGRDALEGIEGDNGLHAVHFRQQEAIFRDIVGNPFAPVAFDPRWRTPDVLGLAHAISDDGGYERLPILSDALLDADCDSEVLIDYCRTPAAHARSCWALDLILDRKG